MLNPELKPPTTNHQTLNTKPLTINARSRLGEAGAELKPAVGGAKAISETFPEETGPGEAMMDRVKIGNGRASLRNGAGDHMKRAKPKQANHRWRDAAWQQGRASRSSPPSLTNIETGWGTRPPFPPLDPPPPFPEQIHPQP